MISDELVEDVKNYWDKWSTNPVQNLKLLRSIANGLLSAIKLAESQAATGHHYEYRGPAHDSFNKGR
jgi:hypothetical protein